MIHKRFKIKYIIILQIYIIVDNQIKNQLLFYLINILQVLTEKRTVMFKTMVFRFIAHRLQITIALFNLVSYKFL
jgi:hypothetical protein